MLCGIISGHFCSKKFTIRRQYRKYCTQTEVLELGHFIAILGHSYFFSLVS